MPTRSKMAPTCAHRSHRYDVLHGVQPRQSDIVRRHILPILAIWLGVAWTIVWVEPLAAQDASSPIVINELHYKPAVEVEQVEFIELTNRSSVNVDLSGWALEEAVDYFFPEQTILQPGEFVVVAQDLDEFQAKFGFEPLGPFGGKLSGDGETLIIRDRNAHEVDEVNFQLGFPWPTTGYAPDASIQLLNPGFDNDAPGNWRAAPPTPGQVNRVFADDAPPSITEVSHAPQSPTTGQEVVITARVVDPDGVDGVAVDYQVVTPGNYLSFDDDAYWQDWTRVPMFPQGDNRYQAILPAELQQHRNLIRYRIAATDNNRLPVVVPYPDDLQPNFAYFVYDGLPTWTASPSGGPQDMTTFDFSAVRPLPVYHFIAKQQDVADAMFMSPSGWSKGYMGNDYLWRGTLVYGGRVYDHVKFRARGGMHRYATGKNFWKINFNLGHRFQAYDDYGRPYAVTWDKLNLSSGMQHSSRRFRGEQGLFEALSFRLFNMAGVAASHTHFVHWRVIDDASEQGANQYDGDFWGLYLAIEQVDGHFLDAHDLPDGNLYKIDIEANDKQNQGADAAADHSDLAAFMNTYLFGGASQEWWRSNFDLDWFYSYRAIVEAVRHYDINHGKNYHYFNNPALQKWQVIPWDVDITWSQIVSGVGDDPFYYPILGRAAFQLEYQNRMREIRDLLFNVDQMALLIDEYADLIDTPIDGASMVDADRAKWDYNPLFDTGYVDPERTEKGGFYQAVPSRTFRGMAAYMLDWVRTRGEWIDDTILTDRDHPETPTITYVGPDEWPADQIRLRSSDFADPQGGDTFAAMEWRIGEITIPEAPRYDPNGPTIYEIDAVWESGPLSIFQAELTVPQGALQPWGLYRARVRHQDNTGRWSHWSYPFQFIARPPIAAIPSNLRFSEIMYHPDHFDAIDGDRLEFVELYNAGTEPIDLSRMYFSEGIDYQFPPGTILPPADYLVLAREGATFSFVHKTEPFATYAKGLNNGGETITLSDGYGRVVLSVSYDDDAPWPESADGSGYALVLRDPALDGSQPAHWRAGIELRGSPGRADPEPVVINEVLATGSTYVAGIELYNPSPRPADVSFWYVSDKIRDPQRLQLPAGSVIAPEGFLTLDATTLRAAGVRLNPEGGELVLTAAHADGVPSGYTATMTYGPSLPDQAYGRVVTSDGRVHIVPVALPSLGAANDRAQVGPVVISEIAFGLDGTGYEYIKLTNIGDRPVNLYGPRNGPEMRPTPETVIWKVDGIGLTLPAGLTLAPGADLRLVADDPLTLCEASGVAAPRLVGPYPRRLSGDGQVLAVSAPMIVQPDSISLVEIDRVTYRSEMPWPVRASQSGTVLERIDLHGFGSEPANWRLRTVQDASSDTVNAAMTVLCAFVALPVAASQQPQIEWVTQGAEDVTGYLLWREGTTPADDLLLTEEPIAVTCAAPCVARYVFLDQALSPANAVYRLEAVGPGGETRVLGYTQQQRGKHEVFLPLAQRGR